MLAAPRRLNEHMRLKVHRRNRFVRPVSRTPRYSPFGRAVLFFSRPPAAPERRCCGGGYSTEGWQDERTGPGEKGMER